MDTHTIELSAAPRPAVRRALSIVWQDPADRRFIPVAQLRHLVDGTYTFEYLDEARSNPRFFALTEFPSTAKTYVASHLPAFFTNRLMSPHRRAYGRYLHWAGVDELDRADVPLELLARTGGGRATDTFHVVDLPIEDESTFESRFFASGLSHVEAIGDALANVRDGDRLELRPEPENPKNPSAVIIDSLHGQQLGWVPDWLCGSVTRLMQDGWSCTLEAEQVNHDAPAHTRLLCHLSATRG